MVVIAVSGKGGTGKTAISALLVKYMSERGSVLAVDADPDANLPDALGVEVEKTLGDVRESFQRSRESLGTMDKEAWLEGLVFEVIYELDDYDLLVMGRPEGEGCYCFVNNLLRGILRKYIRHYDYVIVDCEAGLELFSRKTIESVDRLVVVTDMSRKGLKTAKKIMDLTRELGFNFDGIYLVGNRIIGEEAKRMIKEFARKVGFTLLELIPYDENVVRLDMLGMPIVEIPDNSPFAKRVRLIAEVLSA